MKTLLKTKLVSHIGYRWMIVAVFGTVVAQPTLAQAYGLENIWSKNRSDPVVQGSTGIQLSGPISNSVSGSNQGGPGAYASGTMTDISNYGNLFTSGSGIAYASPGNGSLIDIGNSSDVPSGAVVSYSDMLTITGTAPVSIRFTEVFNSTTSLLTANSIASVADFLSISGPSSWSTALYSSGSATQVLTFNPGTQVGLAGEIAGGCTAWLGWGAPPASASCSFSGSGPLYMDVLTSGGGYTAQSGTLYPTTSPVPEPESYVILLSGLGLIGLIAYRRKNNFSDLHMAA